MNKHSGYIMSRYGISKDDFVKCICLEYNRYTYGEFTVGDVYLCFCVDDGMIDYYIYDLEFSFMNRFSEQEFNINFRLVSEMRQSRIDEIFNID